MTHSSTRLCAAWTRFGPAQCGFHVVFAEADAARSTRWVPFAQLEKSQASHNETWAIRLKILGTLPINGCGSPLSFCWFYWSLFLVPGLIVTQVSFGKNVELVNAYHAKTNTICVQPD